MELHEIILAKLDKIDNRQESHESQMLQMTVNLALNTQILDQHHRRSTNLEDRFQPIEDHVKFQRKVIKLAIVVLPIVVAVLGLLMKYKA